jgi:hypothetical protein
MTAGPAPEVVGAADGVLAIPIGGTAVFPWSYDTHDEQMLRLYAKGKQRQWDVDGTLDWDHRPDPANPLGMPDTFLWLAGSPLWERLPERERTRVRRHTAGWMYSQFLHSEQFALLIVGKISQTVPELDSKLYAATQLMDEARHAEAFNRYISTKIGVRYGLSGSLGTLFEQVMREPRWDFAPIAAHLVVENMGLAAFWQHREQMRDPLARAFATYVARDEARHVAFGRLLLRKVVPELSAAELRDREEFALEACWALRDRFLGEEMWRELDYGAEECLAIARRSPAHREFRRRLFMRVVPALLDVGLFSPAVQAALTKMGVLGFTRVDDEETRRRDEALADELTDRQLAARRADIAAMAELGGAEPGEAAAHDRAAATPAAAPRTVPGAEPSAGVAP